MTHIAFIYLMAMAQTGHLVVSLVEWFRHHGMLLGTMKGILNFNIGVCVSYPEGVYTLAGVRFSGTDVVVWTPTGDQHRLRSGKNWDPHFTYHGTGGISHLVSYQEYHYERARQPLGGTFSGFEPLLVQGFGREYARVWGRPCKGFDTCITVESNEIAVKEDVVSDTLGEVKTSLPTAYFAVDLVEADKDGLTMAEASKFHQSIICEDLITDTSPWCLVTVGHSGPT